MYLFIHLSIYLFVQWEADNFPWIYSEFGDALEVAQVHPLRNGSYHGFLKMFSVST